MDRPKCKRCKGPLDPFYSPETGYYEWECNNITKDGKQRPAYTDEEVAALIAGLEGDYVAHLEATS